MQAWEPKHRWMTTHDQDFVNHVGKHENLMDPDDWTPESIGIRTPATIEKEMLEMDPNLVKGLQVKLGFYAASFLGVASILIMRVM